MIQRLESSAEDCDAPSPPRSLSPVAAASFAGLPHEILEEIFLYLDHNDRLVVPRIWQNTRAIFAGSARLQYELALRTTAHLDVPWRLPSLQHSASPEREDGASDVSDEDEVDMSNVSPHTGAIRRTIPSVRLADWGSQDTSLCRKRRGDLSAQEKLALLREHDRRWTTLDSEHERTFRVSGQAGVYELQEGIFLMCDDYTNDDDSRPMSVRLIPLPTALDPDLEDPILPITSHKLPFAIADLTMDPTQDLLVVSEYRPESLEQSLQPPTHRYHLLSMSSGQPHPLAKMPALDFPPSPHVSMQTRQLIQVMGDTLCILVSRFGGHWFLAGLGVNLPQNVIIGNDEELVAWNWKTGQVLARLAIPENAWFTSFALLTPTTILLTAASNVSPIMPNEPRSRASIFPPVIQIYSFLANPTHSIVPVQPLSADYMDDTTARPILIAQLDLPAFAPGVILAAFDVRPDPPYPVNASRDGPTLTSEKRFTQSPDHGVLVFQFLVSEPDEHDFEGPINLEGPIIQSQSYELFMLREYAVQLAKEGEERLRRTWSEPDYGYWNLLQAVSWSEWGETGSRIMEETMRRRSWVCSCSGYRFALLVNSNMRQRVVDEDTLEAPPRRCDIVVYDFSPFAVRKTLSKLGVNQFSEWLRLEPHAVDETGDEVEIKVHVEETHLDKRRIWKEDVITRLPYREIKRKRGIMANGIMIDDERVIVVKTQGRRNGDWTTTRQEMTVFCM